VGRVITAQNSSEIEALRPLWKHLCAGLPSPTIFQSFELNQLAARLLTCDRPFVVAAETESGAAIIPAAIGDSTVTLLGDCLFDYRGILAEGDPEALALATETLAELDLPLTVSGLRDPQLDFWGGLNLERFCSAPCVPISEIPADEFCAAHSRLGSRLRKLERAGAELRTYNGNDSHLVRWIYAHKAQQPTRNGVNVFANRRRIDFMVEWCAMAGPQCEIFCFEAGSQMVSALVTFRDKTSRKPARRCYTVCFDSHWEKFSPGTLLVFEVTRRTLAEGLDADFMTGEQPHKLRMATASVPLYRASAQSHVLHALAAELAERARLAA